MARIIVCGYMIRYPLMGMLFAFFHYVLGLSRLGHDVLYLEESGWSQSCYDPARQAHTDDPQPGSQAVQSVMAALGVSIPVWYVDRESGQVWGAEWEDVKQALRTADLLLNIGGVCWLPEFRLCRRRALIDLDPFFTQVGRFAAEGLEEYQVHFSYGTNIGCSNCSIPTQGIHWHPTVPPVVPEIWQLPPNSTQPPQHTPLTTIANWSAYGGVTYKGEYYGQKNEEFLQLLELPSHITQPVELALSGANPQIQAQLKHAGWRIRDAGAISLDWPSYQAYLRNSRGEFSVAKQAYVKTHSGWFSDRSVCYLAAGLPVIVQDTGFTERLSIKQGILTFSSLGEAICCIEDANRDYAVHCQAASAIAEQVFSYKVVLPRLLDIAQGKQTMNTATFDSQL